MTRFQSKIFLHHPGSFPVALGGGPIPRHVTIREGMPTIPFRRAPLADGEVHVWEVELAGVHGLATDRTILSPAERERAARFVQPSDRHRYEISHLAMRHILGAYLGLEGSRLRFSRGSRGKPQLEEHPELRFSLSHSGAHALLAVGVQREVGVDIEMHAPFDHTAIAKVSFSSAEYEALNRLPASEQAIGFFQIWTRKEAYVKARGGGLHLDLQAFDVRLGPVGPFLVSHGRDAAAQGSWSIVPLDAPSGYSAALACEGTTPEFRIYRYSPGAS